MRRLEHVGIAVADVAHTLRVFDEVLGRKPYKAEAVMQEGVRTHFVDAGSAKIELLESLGSDSPIGKFLEKRGEGLHHLAFEVDDIDSEVARLEPMGYTLLGAPHPGADGKRIVFLHPRDTARILVELCQQGTYPVPAADGDRQTVYVPNGEEADRLSHALTRHARVVREPSSRVDLAVVFDEEAESPLDARSRASVSGLGGDVISIDVGNSHPVKIPTALWSRLPDPWALLADLVAASL